MPALSISTVAAKRGIAARMGSASYSYYYVYEAFAPLLERWASVILSRADGEGSPADVRTGFLAVDAARNDTDVHLGFVPLDTFQRMPGVPNVAFPFWDFPDVLDEWARTAGTLDLLLTSSEFTRDAFVRAGVRTPIRIVRVPARPAWLALPPWQPAQRVVVDCPCYVVPSAPARPAPLFSRAKAFYQRHVRPRLSARSTDTLRAAAYAWRDSAAADCPATAQLELSGIVYTTVFNPFDQRKNWPDLVSAFLFALRDRDDATLVVKLAVPPDRAAAGLNQVLAFHRQLGLAHRCKLVLVSAYLSDAQMLELARGTTYYLNASRCEGACLPLQDFLAAARPAIAPRHTAIADYFDDACGFVAESHPEPASWPQDPARGYATTWHRLVWPSLRDRIGESYDAARQPRYETLAAAARARMIAMAGSEVVWTQLSAALDSIAIDE